MTGAGQPPPAGETYDGLLNQIMFNTLDLDYQVAADKRAKHPATRTPAQRVITTLMVVLLFGTMIGISALRTAQQKPADAAERDQLVAQVHLRQQRLDVMHSQLSALEVAVGDLQNNVSTGRALLHQTEGALTTLAGVAGASAVTGPGVQITADDAPGAIGSTQGGVILDTDLQALVNALWTAGAEAISINGHRLTSLTAIRFAGRAITVDYRSLTPPYVIDAIGNPDTLPARLLETPGGQAWLSLKANFGIAFDTVTSNGLTLLGDPSTQLLEAKPVASR